MAQNEFSEKVLEDLRKQVFPQVEEASNRVIVANERIRILSTRAESLTALKQTLAEEIASLKAQLGGADDLDGLAAINRQVCTKETEVKGIEERIESLNKGGTAFLAARKEAEEAKTNLQRTIHQAIQNCRLSYENELNDLLEKAWLFYQAWRDAIWSIYFEKGSSPGPYLYGLFIDNKRSDFIIRGQF